MGITARVRTVDPRNTKSAWRPSTSTWRSSSFGQSLSPGNEQREYWGSQAADEQGSRNLLGIKSPVIDELIEELIKAPDRASLVAHTRALDRVLQYGYYVIPHYHVSAFSRGLLGQVPPPRDLAQIRRRPRHLVGRSQAPSRRSRRRRARCKKGEAK